jgi:hypothetical protein
MLDGAMLDGVMLELMLLGAAELSAALMLLGAAELIACDELLLTFDDEPPPQALSTKALTSGKASLVN